jgi:hypothetical protein
MLKRLGFVCGASAALGVYEFCLRPRAARWGATDEELDGLWPGDELVAAPVYSATHAITIHAPADAVWPWLVQIGQDRAGYYSYSWLENLFGADIHNRLKIIPEFQTRQVGDEVWMAPKHKYGGQARMIVGRLDPGRAMVLIPPAPLTCDPATQQVRAEGVWALIVHPIDKNTTRLICRGLGERKSTFSARFWEYAFWEPAHFIMERKMMKTIKALAERSWSSTQRAPIEECLHRGQIAVEERSCF